MAVCRAETKKTRETKKSTLIKINAFRDGKNQYCERMIVNWWACLISQRYSSSVSICIYFSFFIFIHLFISWDFVLSIRSWRIESSIRFFVSIRAANRCGNFRSSILMNSLMCGLRQSGISRRRDVMQENTWMNTRAHQNNDKCVHYFYSRSDGTGLFRWCALHAQKHVRTTFNYVYLCQKQTHLLRRCFRFSAENIWRR